MTSAWIPKFNVGDFLQFEFTLEDPLKWYNEKFYIIAIDKDCYRISSEQTGPPTKFRYGPAIDNGYRTDNCYRNCNPAINLNK